MYYEKCDLFRIGETNMHTLRPSFYFFPFVEFPHDGMKLAVYAEEMPTMIYFIWKL